MTSDPLTNIARQRVGQVLRGKWRLDGLLGIGGMAAVFAATHRNGNRVAIKMLHPQIAIDPSIEQRFLREGYVANSIGHEGAVSVLDDDVTDDGAVFLVMGLLEGETLDARAERLGGHLPTAEVISFADQLLDVLAAAHSKGVVHRDIKPENLFVTTKGELKVLDFGIARLLERAGSSSATKTGSMLGTPAFMPPEQALGYVREVDQRSDIWAVGAVMFTLLTGRTVHPGTTVNEQLITAATKPVCPIITVLPDLPPFLAHIIDRALAFDKAKRWDSAIEMLDAIRESMEATVVASLAHEQIAAGTMAAAPRRSQVVSFPEINVRPPSGSGTAAMTGPAPTPVAASTAAPATMADPGPTTVSTMAVGRTVGRATAVRSRHVSAALIAVATGGGLILAIVVIGLGVLLSNLEPAEVAAPFTSATAPGAYTSTTPSPPVGSATGQQDPTVDPSELPTVEPARVDIVAQGGACRITIDRVDKGSTPIESLDVTPGDHEVRCASDGGTQVQKVHATAAGSHTVTFLVGASKTATPARTPPLTKTAPQPTRTVNPLDMR